ncbi:MAG: RDD family protein [Spirochaetaceae bacterium]|jgi:uncharacterized RDD family membrane protein YckC|nr:RDD family protein [Spirochaetaceae bacterium]
MSFLGIHLSETPAGYRRRRFLAFVLDAALVLLVVFVVYLITGTPDYPGIKEAMDAVKEAGDGPETQELMNRVFSLFNAAYIETLLIWFAAEALGQFFLKGASLGKFIMGLRILPMNPDRSWTLHYLLLTLRSALKLIMLYLFQGFPFFLAILSIFVTQKARAGYDIFVKTYVHDLRGKGPFPAARRETPPDGQNL